MADCVYLFLDEGGNFDFSPRGTRYFVLTSIATRRPFNAHFGLDDYRHDCLEFGLDTEYFHCAEDNTHVRAKVFDLITTHLRQFSIDSLVVEKSKTGPALRGDKWFYPEMLGYLLRHAIEKETRKGVEEVIVITDTIPLKKKRQAIEKAVKLVLGHILPTGIRYRVLHHSSRSHYSLQIADYCNWALFRKWERGDDSAYRLVHREVRRAFDIYRSGARRYF